MRCVSSETLMGVWLAVFYDEDFAGTYVAPPSDKFYGCPVEDCLGDGQFDGCPLCLGTIQRCAFLRSGSVGGVCFACCLCVYCLLMAIWLQLPLACYCEMLADAWSLVPLSVGGLSGVTPRNLVCWTLSLWRVLDGVCPSSELANTVVQGWSAGTYLVSPPSTQALEVSYSSNLSPSPTLRDNSADEIVSPSSLLDDGLDGSDVDSLEGEESISSVALKNSFATTDAISWVFDLIASAQGPGFSDDARRRVRASSPPFSLFSVGVNLDMCGVLPSEGFLCLLWGPVWVRSSPQMLGQLTCSLLASLSGFV
ncbi:hypothetical protein Peur_004608 [Populus x canadensis]